MYNLSKLLFILKLISFGWLVVHRQAETFADVVMLPVISHHVQRPCSESFKLGQIYTFIWAMIK